MSFWVPESSRLPLTLRKGIAWDWGNLRSHSPVTYQAPFMVLGSIASFFLKKKELY